MKNRTLVGAFAALSAPLLGVDIFMNGMGIGGSEYQHTTLGGIFYFMYMSGWMLCIWELAKMQAAGARAGRYVLIVQLSFLSIANLSNVYEIIYPESADESFVYHLMDIFWPISNLTMIVTGIFILKSRVIQGWQRYVPMVVSLWIPSSIAMYFFIGDTNRTFEIYVACYSMAAWALMGFAVATAQTPIPRVTAEKADF